MAENNRRGPQFHWLDNVNLNMNDIQQRLTQEHNIQRHVGQVVRGVIPAGPQYDYYPNPYLQHLYHRQQQNGATGATNAPDPHSAVINLDLEDIDAQLGELVAQAQRDGARLEGDVNQNTPATHTHGHTHGHTHAPANARRPNIVGTLDWKILLSSGSFAIILFLRLMADHILGLLMFIALTAVFYYSNLKMVEIVHITSLRDHQSGKNVTLMCGWLLLFLSANILCVYYVFSDQELWKVLYFNLPSNWQGSIFDLFWVTVITDSVLRFSTIIIKSLLSLLPQICLPQKKRGKYFMFIEVVSQIYRMLVPIIPWLHFLYDQPKSGRLIFAAILVIIYLLLKGYGLYQELINLRKAIARLKTDMMYGSKPSAEDIQSKGDNCCPICQDDYQDPIMLACKHIFCENCVSVWFDREKTCPMCRAEIQTDNPQWRDGSTSSHLQWY